MQPTEKDVPVATYKDQLPVIAQQNLERDHQFIKETNESMDTMMIFAGLFSAAITQFVSSTYLGLKADPSDLTNQLLSASLMLQRHPDAPIPDFTDPNDFQPSNLNITINALLFFSLILSLLSALGAMIVKQWIRRYETYGVKESLLYKKLRRRAKKQMVMEDWHLKQVINYIPYALHMALAIFLSAVLVWISTLNRQTMVPSAILVALAALAYVFIGVASFVSRVTGHLQRDTDIETGDQFGHPKPVALTPVMFILNPPTDLKVRGVQERPPIAKMTDARVWIDAIMHSEDHDILIEAFYDLRTANWAQVKINDLLFKYGEDVLKRCSDVAHALWQSSGETSFLKEGAEEKARGVCLFIEWFYYQLSVKQRRILKNWPDSAIAKALMLDPFNGNPPPNMEGQMPTLEDVALGNSIVAKLHHVQLAEGSICEMCIVDYERDDRDVRYLIPRNETPQEYETNFIARQDWETRMQELVSACISSDADCLLHYATKSGEKDVKKRIKASYQCLLLGVWAYRGHLSHQHSYVSLRGMLISVRSTLEETDARVEWFDQLYRHANATAPGPDEGQERQ